MELVPGGRHGSRRTDKLAGLVAHLPQVVGLSEPPAMALASWPE